MKKKRDLAMLVVELRKYLGLSQVAFAAAVGISPTYVGQIERGIHIPSEDVINLICKAFDVNKMYFEDDGKKGLLTVDEAVKKSDLESGPAQRLKQARLNKGWLQVELSRYSGVSQPAITRFEAGTKLTSKQGLKLAEALEVGFDWLMDGLEEKKDFPADKKMIDWLWDHKEVREKIWNLMKEESKNE